MSGFSSRVPDICWQVIRDHVEEKKKSSKVLDANLKHFFDVPIPTEPTSVSKRME